MLALANLMSDGSAARGYVRPSWIRPFFLWIRTEVGFLLLRAMRAAFFTVVVFVRPLATVFEPRSADGIPGAWSGVPKA